MKVQNGPRKKAPDGTSWCSAHKRFEPVSRFAKRSSRHRKIGVQSFCRAGQKSYWVKWKKALRRKAA